MITTIKLKKKTKMKLDSFRKEGESYDFVVNRLIEQAKRKELKAKLKEAYLEMADRDKKLVGEWEAASSEL